MSYNFVFFIISHYIIPSAVIVTFHLQSFRVSSRQRSGNIFFFYWGFTVLCQFLLCSKVNQLCVYIRALPLGPQSTLPPISSVCQSTKLSFLCYTARSHQLSVLYMACTYVNLFPSSSSPSVSTSLLTTSVSIPVFQIGSSVLFFQIPHIYVNIYLFFSF